MKKILPAAAITLAAVAVLCDSPLSAFAATAPAPVIGVGIKGVSGPGFPGTWMTASIARGAGQAWTLQVTNAGNVRETILLVPSGAMGLYAGGPAKQPASKLDNVLRVTSFSLAPGASATVTDTVTIPVAAPLGLVPGNAPGASPSLAVNTIWAYAGPVGGGQVRMAVGAGFRQYITVTK